MLCLKSGTTRGLARTTSTPFHVALLLEIRIEQKKRNQTDNKPEDVFHSTMRVVCYIFDLLLDLAAREEGAAVLQSFKGKESVRAEFAPNCGVEARRLAG